MLKSLKNTQMYIKLLNLKNNTNCVVKLGKFDYIQISTKKTTFQSSLNDFGGY